MIPQLQCTCAYLKWPGQTECKPRFGPPPPPAPQTCHSPLARWDGRRRACWSWCWLYIATTALALVSVNVQCGYNAACLTLPSLRPAWHQHQAEQKCRCATRARHQPFEELSMHSRPSLLSVHMITAWSAAMIRGLQLAPHPPASTHPSLVAYAAMSRHIIPCHYIATLNHAMLGYVA